MRNLLIFQLLLTLIFFTSCDHAKPVPKDKESFIGLWISYSGFNIEIKSIGTAKLTQIGNTQDPDFNKLNIPVAPTVTEEMFVHFKGDSVLVVRKPLYYAKEYHIDKSPYQDGDTSRMIINGVMLTKH